MISKALLPLFLFSSVLSVKGCLDSRKFSQTFAAEMKGKALETLFSQGKFLGEGSFGKVNEIAWGTGNAAAKKVKKPYHPMEIKVQESEIDFMSKMAKLGAVVDFHGCLETSSNLFLVQEKLYKDLQAATLMVTFKGMSVATRMNLYIKIIKKFEALHNKGIIHEDIKPENIMATDNTATDFRIIDLGLSCYVKGQVLGGSPAFNGPEKIGRNMPTCSPQHDVYALGLTFAVMESKFESIFYGLGNTCFTSNLSSTCIATLHNNIKSALAKSGMSAMTNVILKACAASTLSRYASMADFAKDLNLVYQSVKPKDVVAEIDKVDFKDLLASKAKVDLGKDIGDQKKNEMGYLKKDKFYLENKVLLKSIKANMYNKDGKPTTKDELLVKYGHINERIDAQNNQPNPTGSVKVSKRKFKQEDPFKLNKEAPNKEIYNKPVGNQNIAMRSKRAKVEVKPPYGIDEIKPVQKAIDNGNKDYKPIFGNNDRFGQQKANPIGGGYLGNVPAKKIGEVVLGNYLPGAKFENQPPTQNVPQYEPKQQQHKVIEPVQGNNEYNPYAGKYDLPKKPAVNPYEYKPFDLNQYAPKTYDTNAYKENLNGGRYYYGVNGEKIYY